MKEKMFRCPKCDHQFGDTLNGVCPSCGYLELIMFKWINPKYKIGDYNGNKR